MSSAPSFVSAAIGGIPDEARLMYVMLPYLAAPSFVLRLGKVVDGEFACWRGVIVSSAADGMAWAEEHGWRPTSVSLGAIASVGDLLAVFGRA